MPVPILLLAFNVKKKKFFFNQSPSQRKPLKCVCFGLSVEFYQKTYHIITDIYRKWPMESSLVVQGIAFNQKVLGSNPHQVLQQNQKPELVTTLLVTLTSKIGVIWSNWSNDRVILKIKFYLKYLSLAQIFLGFRTSNIHISIGESFLQLPLKNTCSILFVK